MTICISAKLTLNLMARFHNNNTTNHLCGRTNHKIVQQAEQVYDFGFVNGQVSCSLTPPKHSFLAYNKHKQNRNIFTLIKITLASRSIILPQLSKHIYWFRLSMYMCASIWTTSYSYWSCLRCGWFIDYFRFSHLHSINLNP